jgi:hypothetical protein
MALDESMPIWNDSLLVGVHTDGRGHLAAHHGS